MIAHRRREYAAGNHFSFSDPIQRASGDLNASDGIEYETWAERIKGEYGYFGRSNDQKLGAWARRTPGNNHKDPDGEEEEFRWLANRAGDGSGTPSPELWKTASPTTRSADASPTHGHHSDRDRLIYPNPRAQAIARYRREMLDMVRDMPETGYELSLRDIVEAPRIARTEHQAATKEERELPKDNDEKAKDQKNNKEKKKKGKSWRRMSRSESMDTGGFLLKMFFPVASGTGRKSSGCPASGSKVSPRPIKPILTEGTEGELRQKNEPGRMGRGGSSSSSSSSSNSSSRRRSLSSCYSFFHTWKRKGRGI